MSGQCEDVDAQAIREAEIVVQQTELLHIYLAKQQATEEQQAEMAKEPRKGTMPWFRKHQDDPVVSGSKLTIYGAAWLLLKFKRDGKVTQEAFKQLLRILARDPSGMLPPGHNLPKCVPNAREPLCVCVCGGGGE